MDQIVSHMVQLEIPTCTLYKPDTCKCAEIADYQNISMNFKSLDAGLLF